MWFDGTIHGAKLEIKLFSEDAPDICIIIKYSSLKYSATIYSEHQYNSSNKTMLHVYKSISRFADDERYYSKYSIRSIVIIPAFLPMNIAGMKLVEDFENQNLPNNMEDTAKAVVEQSITFRTDPSTTYTKRLIREVYPCF